MFAILSLTVSLLLVTVPSGNLILKDVSTGVIQQDWTQVAPDLFVRIQGTYHNTTLVFSTAEPATFRVVFLFVFRGAIDVWNLTLRGWGMYEEWGEYQLLEMRFVGTASLDADGRWVVADGTLTLRALGTVVRLFRSPAVPESLRYVEVNTILVMRIVGSEVVPLNLRVSPGWPVPPPRP